MIPSMFWCFGGRSAKEADVRSIDKVEPLDYVKWSFKTHSETACSQYKYNQTCESSHKMMQVEIMQQQWEFALLRPLVVLPRTRLHLVAFSIKRSRCSQDLCTGTMKQMVDWQRSFVRKNLVLVTSPRCRAFAQLASLTQITSVWLLLVVLNSLRVVRSRAQV